MARRHFNARARRIAALRQRPPHRLRWSRWRWPPGRPMRRPQGRSHCRRALRRRPTLPDLRHACRRLHSKPRRPRERRQPHAPATRRHPRAARCRATSPLRAAPPELVTSAAEPARRPRPHATAEPAAATAEPAPPRMPCRAGCSRARLRSTAHAWRRRGAAPGVAAGAAYVSADGRNTSMRRSVISKPMRGSGASARSRRPVIAVW